MSTTDDGFSMTWATQAAVKLPSKLTIVYKVSEKRKIGSARRLKEALFGRMSEPGCRLCLSTTGDGFSMTWTAQASVKVPTKLAIVYKVSEKHPKISKLHEPKWEALQGCP